MRGDPSEYMKVGIVSFMAHPATMKGEGPVLESIREIAEDSFFEAIEVTQIKDPDTRRAAAETLSLSRLDVGYGAQPVLLTEELDLNSLCDPERARAVERMKECVDEAYEIGAGKFSVLSGKDPGESSRSEATDLLVESLKEICSHARGGGDLQVVLETFDRDVDKKCLIGPSKEAADVARRVREEHPTFGLMIDLSHLPQQREDAESALANVREHLVHVHIGNCILEEKGHPAYGDAHPAFGVEGGENDVEELTEFLKCLFDLGYLGGRPGNRPVVSFEVKPYGEQESWSVVSGAKRTLVRAWRAV